MFSLQKNTYTPCASRILGTSAFFCECNKVMSTRVIEYYDWQMQRIRLFRIINMQNAAHRCFLLRYAVFLRDIDTIHDAASEGVV